MDNVKPEHTITVAFVQPIVSPTRVPWFRRLAGYPDIGLRVFSLRRTMEHRPGWETRSNEDYKVEMVSSLFLKQKKGFPGAEGKDMAGRIIPVGLIAKLFKYRPHVVVVSNATEIASVLPVRWIFGTRIVLTAEDTGHSFANISRRNQLLKAFLYRKADLICAHSTECKELLSSLGIPDKRVCFTPWAVDNDYFYRKSRSIQRSQTRKKLGLKGTTLVTVGALISRKGILQLLEAWSDLDLNIRSASSLLIIGDGPKYEQCRSITEEKGLTEVRFTGHLDPDEVAASLGASDAFIFPTLEDVWGLVVNEAMAIGLPILCSRYAGCSTDLVRDGVNGYRFDPLNRNELIRLLSRVITNPHALPGMGRESRGIIQEFTVENSVSTLVDNIRQITYTG